MCIRGVLELCHWIDYHLNIIHCYFCSLLFGNFCRNFLSPKNSERSVCFEFQWETEVLRGLRGLLLWTHCLRLDSLYPERMKKTGLVGESTWQWLCYTKKVQFWEHWDISKNVDFRLCGNLGATDIHLFHCTISPFLEHCECRSNLFQCKSTVLTVHSVAVSLARSA